MGTNLDPNQTGVGPGEGEAPPADPWDLNAYPEDARGLAQQAHAQYQEAQQQAQRWQALGDRDPQQVAQALNYLDHLNSPEFGQATLEAELRRRGVLPEGLGLQEAQELIQWYQAESQAQQQAAEPQYLTAQQAQQMVDERLAQERARLQQETQQTLDQRSEEDWGLQELARQERELQARLDQEGVDLGEQGWGILKGIVRDRLASGEVTEQNFASTIEDSYKVMDAVASARAAAMLRSQGQTPRTGGVGEGLPAGSTTPVTNFATMREALREKMSGGM